MLREKNIPVKSAIVQQRVLKRKRRDAELTLLIFQHINHLISQVATVASLYLDGESHTFEFSWSQTSFLHVSPSAYGFMDISEGYKSLFVAGFFFIAHH